MVSESNTLGSAARAANTDKDGGCVKELISAIVICLFFLGIFTLFDAYVQEKMHEAEVRLEVQLAYQCSHPPKGMKKPVPLLLDYKFFDCKYIGDLQK